MSKPKTIGCYTQLKIRTRHPKTIEENQYEDLALQWVPAIKKAEILGEAQVMKPPCIGLGPCEAFREKEKQKNPPSKEKNKPFACSDFDVTMYTPSTSLT